MIKLTAVKQLQGKPDMEFQLTILNPSGIIGIVDFPISKSCALILFNNQQVPVKESAAEVLAMLQEASPLNNQVQASALGNGGQNNGI